MESVEKSRAQADTGYLFEDYFWQKSSYLIYGRHEEN